MCAYATTVIYSKSVRKYSRAETTHHVLKHGLLLLQATYVSHMKQIEVMQPQSKLLASLIALGAVSTHDLVTHSWARGGHSTGCAPPRRDRRTLHDPTQNAANAKRLFR